MADSILSTGLQGIQNGVNTANQAARDIVRATTTEQDADGEVTADITEAVVDLKVGEIQAKASAAVVRTADEVLGTLVDIKA